MKATRTIDGAAADRIDWLPDTPRGLLDAMGPWSSHRFDLTDDQYDRLAEILTRIPGTIGGVGAELDPMERVESSRVFPDTLQRAHLSMVAVLWLERCRGEFGIRRDVSRAVMRLDGRWVVEVCP